MQRFLATTVLALSISLATPALADQETNHLNHFKGKPAETLDAAITNFSDCNRQLAALLAQDSLTADDMVKVHQLTYTLENALKKLRDELAGLAETLEAVHVSSEQLDDTTLKAQGQKYLGTARRIIR